MKASRVWGAIFALAAVALLVLSVVERDGGLLWMPGMHVVGWMLLLVATALATYEPADAEATRARLEARAREEEVGRKAA